MSVLLFSGIGNVYENSFRRIHHKSFRSATRICQSVWCKVLVGTFKEHHLTYTSCCVVLGFDFASVVHIRLYMYLLRGSLNAHILCPDR